MKKILDYAKARYTTKHYDTSKGLSAAELKELKELLRLAPSSVNAQPWHFIIARTAEGKARMAKATEGPFEFNKGKIMESAMTVLFCSRLSLPAEYLQHLTDKEREDGRFGGNAEIEKAGHDGRAYFAGLHEKQNDVAIWNAKQTYLNIGAFLLGAAAMGLDSTAIEGFDPAPLEREFDLKAKGLAPLCFVSVGHRAAHDRNATRPKSRLTEAELVTEI